VRPAARAPGGTMPPPMAPIPSPMPPPGPAAIERDAPMPMPAPGPMGSPYVADGPRPVAPAPAPHFPAPVASTPPAGAGAPVVPLPASNPASRAAEKRNLVGAGAKRVPGRALSPPSKRGVHLEPLDPKVVKMLDLQSSILERLRGKLDLDKIPIERLHEEDLWQRAERATIDLVETLETSGELPKYIDQDTLIKETL